MTRNDNTQSKLVSCAQGARNLSKREAFKRGYESALKDRPYDYDIPERGEAICYARGRAFAIWSRVSRQPSCRWKNGVLSRAAEERLLKAIYCRAVI